MLDPPGALGPDAWVSVLGSSVSSSPRQSGLSSPAFLVTWLLLVPSPAVLGKSHEPVELAGATSSVVHRRLGCLARAWPSSCRPGAASAGPLGPAPR